MTHQLSQPPRRLIDKTYTELDRYGRLFPFIRDLHEAFSLNFQYILSFGCSSGEECITLSKLFPLAHVTGTDINDEMVAKAKKLCAGDLRIEVLPYETFWARSLRFDLICAMSVLFEMPHQFIPKKQWEAALRDPARRQGALEYFMGKLKDKFPFAEFESITAQLDARLRTGGLLILQNANYRFMETSVGRARYKSITIPGTNFETMPKGDKNNQVLDYNDFTEIVFRKQRQTATGWLSTFWRSR